MVVGATSGTSASPCASQRLEHLGRLSERQVGHDQPAGARPARRRSTKRLDARREDHVRVAHQHHRDARRQRARHLEHARDVRARRPAPACRRRGSPGRRPAGPSRARRARSGPRPPDARLADPQRVLERGEAAHHIGHQRRALAVRANASAMRSIAARLRRCSRPAPASTSARSLSPRPDRQTRSSSPSCCASAQASAWAVSSAGMMPSRRASSLERRQRLAVGHRHIARTAAVAQVRVLGPGARIVQARRDRVRLHDLPLLVLHHRRARAVQDPRARRRPSAARRGGSCGCPRRRPRRRPARPPRRRMNAAKMPIALEPPPTQAMTRCGSLPSRSSICARASSPITRCRSRTSAG